MGRMLGREMVACLFLLALLAACASGSPTDLLNLLNVVIPESADANAGYGSDRPLEQAASQTRIKMTTTRSSQHSMAPDESLVTTGPANNSNVSSHPPKPQQKVCTDPAGTGMPNVLMPAMGCQSDWTSADPRHWGPLAWRTFHTFAANYPCPPTQMAYQACINFTYALPYMIPCIYCGWDFGEFINVNTQLSGTYDDKCMGSRSNENGQDESLCLRPEEACKSQESLTSFFVRAHNNVNSFHHPCEPRWTVERTFKEYKTVHLFCPHNVVVGTKQVCRGFYCPNQGGPNPMGGCRCNQSGPVGSGGNYGEGHLGLMGQHQCPGN